MRLQASAAGGAPCLEWGVSTGLPSVLVSPPWLADEEPCPPLNVEPPPTSTTLPDELRASWLERIPRRETNEDQSDEALDRCLDSHERGQPLREADIARLNDEGLEELLEAAAADLPTRIAEYALARLGARALGPLVASSAATFAKTPLHRAFAHAFSPELARLYARAWYDAPRLSPEEMTEAPEPTTFERWCHAHASAATNVLLPLALEVEARDAEPSRRALTLMALAGLPVAEQALKAGLSPEASPRWLGYEPMSDAVSPWVPVVLADGRADTLGKLIEGVWCPALARNLSRLQDVEAASDARGRSELWMVAYAWLRAQGERAEKALSSPGFVAHRDDDPRDTLKVSSPPLALPSFWNLDALPTLVLRDGTPIPHDAMHHLATMMHYARADAPYRGLLEVRDACDPDSLDAFLCALVDEHGKAGRDHRDAWTVAMSLVLGGWRVIECFRDYLAGASDVANELLARDDVDHDQNTFASHGTLHGATELVWLLDDLDGAKGWLALRFLSRDDDAFVSHRATRVLEANARKHGWHQPTLRLRELPILDDQTPWDERSRAMWEVATEWLTEVVEHERELGERWSVATLETLTASTAARELLPRLAFHAHGPDDTITAFRATADGFQSMEGGDFDLGQDVEVSLAPS